MRCSRIETIGSYGEIVDLLEQTRDLVHEPSAAPPTLEEIGVEKTESGYRVRLIYQCESEEECLPIILLSDPD